MVEIDPFSANSPLVDMDKFLSWIIYEDSDILVLNKPGWLVCHPSKEGPLSSLVGAARIYLGLEKLHLVARLDRETSGLVLIAKKTSVARKYQMAIQDRIVVKEYLAILEGSLSESVKVDQNIAHRPKGIVKIKNHVSYDRTSKSAITIFEPLFFNDDYTYARIIPQTGRKHQIRVHAEWMGNPVVGDKIYGPDERLYIEFIESGWTRNLDKLLPMKRQALHCYKYQFNFPSETVSFTAPLCLDMEIFVREKINYKEMESSVQS